MRAHETTEGRTVTCQTHEEAGKDESSRDHWSENCHMPDTWRSREGWELMRPLKWELSHARHMKKQGS